MGELMEQDINGLVSRQHSYFAEGETRSLSFRIGQLRRLKEAVQGYESRIMEAVRRDFNKSEYESYLSEYSSVLMEINLMLRHLAKWSKPARVRTPMTHLGSRSYIYAEPYGVTLIIAPWNYPFQLALAPLIGAVAAGNCAVIKPSELAPHTSQTIADMIAEYFPDTYIAVVQGDAEASTALLKERFDYIFYTGSTHVGRLVMQAAADHLTPVTLELGGKSPCIVHHDARLDVAAMRIVWGKFFNAGQTCVAPDYLYVHRSVKDDLVNKLIRAIEEMHGERISIGEFTHIVNDRHFERLETYLEDGKIIYGGGRHKDSRLFEPTLLGEVKWEDRVMREEIFGPILPILEYDSLEEAMRQVNSKSKPLALYLFTESQAVQDRVLREIPFGGGCMNDVIYHLVNPHLPFGGVGESGSGAYHGRASFDLFSHKKSVLKQTTRFDFKFRYPHYKNALKLLKKFYR